MKQFSLDLHITRQGWVLISVLLVSLAVVGVVFSITSRLSKIETSLDVAKNEYVETADVVSRYLALESVASEGKSVLLQEPLFSYVDKVTRDLKLAQRIDYIRPEERTRDDGEVEEVVHLAFKGIMLTEFTTFLHHIEVRKREIIVKAASIKKDAKKNLDVQLTLQKT